MASFSFRRPEPLQANHSIEGFDCGVPELNNYLRKHALVSQNSRASRTYVCCREDGQLVGYYSLAFQSIPSLEAPGRMKKGMPRNDIPAILLARLAVDTTVQGIGLGRELIRDAFVRAISAAEIAGCRALIVDAKDEEVAAYYQKLGFETFASNPLRLFLLMKDIEKSLQA